MGSPSGATVSRRDLVRILSSGAAVGVTGLAGCTGDDNTSTDENGSSDGNGSGSGGNGNGNGTNGSGNGGNGNGNGTNDSTETGQMTDAAFVVPSDLSYTEIQANLGGAADADPHTLPSAINAFYLTYNSRNDEIANHLIDEISIDGNTMSLTISDEYTWHNGDDVTADDVLTQFKRAWITEGDPRLAESGIRGLWDSYEGIQKAGDYSVEVSLSGEQNPRLAQLNLFYAQSNGPGVLWTPHAVFNEYIEAYEDASTDDERESVRSDLTGFSWEMSEAYGNGLWQIEDIAPNQLTLSIYEDHPNADQLNFETHEIRSMEQALPAARNNEIDLFSSSIDENSAGTLPENWEMTSVSTAGAPGLQVNHQHEIYGQSEVKQAFAHIMDSNEVTQVMGENAWRTVPSNYVFRETFMDPYMGSPIEGELIEYDSAEEAAALLESADFSQEDGTWYKPDGEPFSPTINTFQNDTWPTVANTVAGQLQNFGIQAEVEVEEGGNFFAKFPNNEYDLVIEFWSGGSANPYFGFSRNMVGFGGASMQYPEEVEAPPVGERDGSLETYTVQNLLDAALNAPNDDEFMSAIRELAWVANYTLPSIPTGVQLNPTFFDSDDWSFPSSDSDDWGWGTYWLMAEGNLQATQQ